MDIDVDQSGKIEDVPDTVLAMANGISRSIVLRSRVKRQAFAELRASGITRKPATLKIFASSLCLLLEPVVEENLWVTIDKEYPGHEATIKAMILRYFRSSGTWVHSQQIRFGLVSRHSPAHHLAADVYHGDRSPDEWINWKRLRRALGKNK